jgi:endo-1,4-beta-xylanase
MLARRTALKAMLLAAPGFFPALSAIAKLPTSLKNAYKGRFLVGAAINAAQITGKDVRGDALVRAQFNSISPEDCLKWENVHPQPDRYDFSLTDRYVAFGRRNRMFTVGHVLVWHNQTPDWVFRDDKGELLDRKALLARLKHHIYTVVGRYKGKIHSWDVVNEPIDEDGSMRQSLWLKIIGEDYIAKAFRYAHEADPKALLVYNDYSIENEVKRKGADALIAKLKADGAPITSVGLQGHYRLDWPSLEQLDATISDFGKMGLKVPMTELDIDVLPPATSQQTADVSLKVAADPALNPYPDGLPDEVQKQLAERYAELFRIFLKHRGVVDRVSFWGVSDGDNWKNDWPVKGRTNYPLLFDRAHKPKPAFDAVIREAQLQKPIR